jgi:hypothetical protein
MNGRKCDVVLVPNIWYHVKELKKGGKNTLPNLVKALKQKGRIFVSRPQDSFPLNLSSTNR